MSSLSLSLLKFEKKSLHVTKDKTISSFKMLYRAFSYSLNYPLLMLIVYLLMFANSMLNTYNPGLGEQLIHILTQNDVSEHLTKAVLTRFGIDILIAIVECLLYYSRARLALKVERKIQGEFYNSLLNKDVEYFDQKKIGDLTSRINTDLQSVKSLGITDISGLFQKGFTLLGSLVFMLNLSPKLFILYLIMLTPRVGLLWSFKDKFRQFHQKLNKLKGDANSIATETFLNIRTVKSFSTEEKEFMKYDKKLDEYQEAHDSLAKKELLHEIGKHFFKTIMFVAITLQGASIVLNKELTPYQLSRFIGLTRDFSRAFLMLEGNVKRIISSLANAERIFKELDAKPKVTPNEDKIVYEKDVRGEVIFKDVSFSYPTKKEVQVLKKINLNIKKGEHVALVGESGGGKSTIVALLQRFYDPTNGEILIDGKNLKDYNLKWLHSRMGLISQDPALFSGTIEDNIVYGVDKYTSEDVDNAVNHSYMKKFVEDKNLFPEGLNSNVGERGNKLSGGQKQRVAIARALIKKPDILILDEATSALDADSEYQIMKGLENLLKNKSQTVIVIAHRLSTIMHCDTIVVCKSGEIIEKGTHHELIEKDGIYRNLVEMQLSPMKIKSESI